MSVTDNTIRSSITDIPRNAGDKDVFGIEPFENGLIRFINHTNTPITIALQGEWGSGKTSLMNSLKLNLSDKDHSKYHSIWLNTWEYALMKDASSTLMDIITGLIEETSRIANLDESQTRKMINKLWGIGKTAMTLAAKTAANKVIDGSSEVVEGLLSEKRKSSIGEIRYELESVIEECIKKDNKAGFIFFIDDLDRIDPPVAVQLLELLKNIFTLKNCIFILAIDYDVVVKGLEPKFGKLSEKNEREFRSFFDKIIQVPFSMPVTSYKIDNFLKESLLSTNYLSNGNSGDSELIGKFSEISNLSVGTNPRGLKRLLNSLSLINCINEMKEVSEENEDLKNPLELLVNFTLVSIQIAYPPVYKLLTMYPGFDKWNENVALQMNLKPLDSEMKEKLTHSKEFDEEWEQILFRLCETDHYLKKKALNISRLLNSLKQSINVQGEDVEDIVGSVISLSSVTNVEAFDKPVVDYHKGHFLKNLRSKLLPLLKEQLPDIANHITDQGKRVQSNAYIKFTPQNWGHWIRLHSHPVNGKIRLIINTDRWIFPAKFSSPQKCLEESGKYEQFLELEKEYAKRSGSHPDFSFTNFGDHISKRDGRIVLYYGAYIDLPSTDNFSEPENLNKIRTVVAEIYELSVKISDQLMTA